MAKKITAASPKAPAGSRPATVELVTDQDSTPLPRIEQWPPFLYAHHPNSWTVVGGRLIPRLRVIALQPGVSNVRKTKEGRYVLGDMKSHIAPRGWRVIDWEHGPNGESYMACVETSPDGKNIRDSYISVFETAYPGAKDTRTDEDAYSLWASSLSPDVVPPCPVFVAEKLLEQYETKLLGFQDKLATGTSAYRGPVAQMQAAVKVVSQYVDECNAAAKPVASRRGSVQVEP